jgi:shikimate dehydrogenase
MSVVDVIAPKRRLLVGLIGAPIKHSASPSMHETAAAALGVHGFYQLIEIAGADTTMLRQIIDGLRLIGFAGSNVTFPYKEAILPLLDDLSPAARAIGAVNTVVVKDGKLTGYNTDATGFARVVADPLAASGHGPVALIGAGGVGKAAGFALAEQGCAEVRIFDRDRAKAEVLVQSLDGVGKARIVGSVEEALEDAVGLVNGTPVGMLPSTDSPVPAGLLHGGLWVADAVYSPLWTPLLLAAKAAGATPITGRELAIAQAVDAFKLFSGLDPSQDVMAAAFDRIMELRRTGTMPG